MQNSHHLVSGQMLSTFCIAYAVFRESSYDHMIISLIISYHHYNCHQLDIMIPGLAAILVSVHIESAWKTRQLYYDATGCFQREKIKQFLVADLKVQTISGQSACVNFGFKTVP